MKGPLIILSGPSGSGKSTVLGRLLQTGDLPLRPAVSATTRERRPREQEGVSYHFWTAERFEQEVQAGAFLEWAEVHGNRYGTLRREVEPFREQGTGVILEIDVQGAGRIRQQCPDNVSIFLRTPTIDDYRKRLEDRGTETKEKIDRRVAAARGELERIGEYTYTVVNDDIDLAVAQMEALLRPLFKR